MTTTMIVLIGLALVFDFLNGIHDSSNIVATMISSRALSPRWALTLTALAGFAGPFIFGVAVAKTVGEKIVIPGTISTIALIAALISAIIWNLFTWLLGLPSSSSHALIGGLIGAAVTESGWGVINIAGIEIVLLVLLTSPILGFFFGFIVTRLITLACWRASPKVNWIFKKGQILTVTALALSHGSNGAQKSMGIITLGLLITGYLSKFEVPIWVIILCASMIALGTSVGGWKLIRTIGGKFYRIRPMDAFSTQFSAALVILGASLLGGPVSTTQVISTAIMGVGSAERINKVRWGVASEIAITWLLTIPATALAGAGMYWIVSRIIS
jgi:PiT family inorganic phosphate transporter